jgi:autophagy-related protein 2
MGIVINLSMVRVQTRCPPPLPSLPHRSGTLVLDLHELRLATSPKTTTAPTTRFADKFRPSGPQADEEPFLSVECKRMVLACSLVSENKAMAFLSAGPLRPETVSDVEQFGRRVNPGFTDIPSLMPPLYPRLTITKSIPHSQSQFPRTSLVLSINIPSVHASISKPLLDCLQYWVDDVAQLVESTMGGDSDTEQGQSRDTSLIGSRFFAKSLKGGSSGSGSGLVVKIGNEGNDIVVKGFISEGGLLFHSLEACADTVYFFNSIL